METVELLVYVVIAIIIGSMIIVAISNTNFKSLYARIRNKMLETKDDEVKYPKSEFGAQLINKWKDCGYGAFQKEYAFVIDENGTLTKNEVLNVQLPKINGCELINGCGNATLLVMPESISLPKVINIKCSTNLEVTV